VEPRNFVLIAALVMIGILAFLTFSVAVSDGITFLVVISFGILAVLGFGVIGALTEKRDE
jgi:hypothetical protein